MPSEEQAIERMGKIVIKDDAKKIITLTVLDEEPGQYIVEHGESGKDISLRELLAYFKKEHASADAPEDVLSATLRNLTVDVTSSRELRNITFNASIALLVAGVQVSVVVHFVYMKHSSPSDKKEFRIRADLRFTTRTGAQERRIWFKGEVSRSQKGWVCTAAWQYLGVRLSVLDVAKALGADDSDLPAFTEHIPALTGAAFTYSFHDKTLGAALTAGDTQVRFVSLPAS